MQLAILIIVCVILVLVVPCAVAWFYTAVALARADKEANKNLLEVVEKEKRMLEQKELQSNHHED